MKRIISERVVLNGERRILLKFPYDQDMIRLIKKIPSARWSSSMRCWHVSDDAGIIREINSVFPGEVIIDIKSPEPNLSERIRMKKEEEERSRKESDREKETIGRAGSNCRKLTSRLSDSAMTDIGKYRKWMEANRYPETTIKIYTEMMVKFLQFVSPREAGECTADDLFDIVENYVLPNGYSQSYQNQLISSVKKFYSHIYRKAMDPGEITRPRPRHHLPNVLGKEEVKRIFSVISNEKHRTMLSLIYACGLRRSELIQLVPGDIERSRGLLRIRQAKGFKDRVVPISEKTIGMIDSYLMHYRPETFLFEGQRAGERYSTSSLEKILKNACAKAGIGKPVSLHWMRHSYATHLLESGTDLRYIQELLGHKSSKTTEIYTHVTTRGIQNIRSPFDDL